MDPCTPPIRLEGQAALVTGAGRGIGRAVALALAAAGASVAAVARSADELAQTAALAAPGTGEVVPFPADVADGAAASGVAAEAERRWGRLDLLVNNAGTSLPVGPVAGTDPEAWWRCQEVNLKGPLCLCRAVLPGMVARGRGRIINVASGAGTRPVPYSSAYSVSKTALIRLSEIMALETRGLGVRVFAINPGMVRTAMSEQMAGSAEGRRYLPWFAGLLNPERDLSPRRAVELVLFLASGRGDTLSGRYLTVDDDVAGLAADSGRLAREGLLNLRLRKP